MTGNYNMPFLVTGFLSLIGGSLANGVYVIQRKRLETKTWDIIYQNKLLHTTKSVFQVHAFNRPARPTDRYTCGHIGIWRTRPRNELGLFFFNGTSYRSRSVLMKSWKGAVTYIWETFRKYISEYVLSKNIDVCSNLIAFYFLTCILWKHNMDISTMHTTY